ncbi:hypothetical protein Dimus_017179 [Dionaea muscipula]
MARRGRPPKSRVVREIAPDDKGDGVLVDSALVEVEVRGIDEGKRQLSDQDLPRMWAEEVELEDSGADRAIPSIVGEGSRILEVPYLRAMINGDGEDLGHSRKALPRSMAGNRDWKIGCQLSQVERLDDEVVISEDEVAAELEFWRHAVIGYVLGDRIPFSAMENFVRSQWKDISMPHIILHELGYFIFRFDSAKDKMAIMEYSWFFKAKPLVLRDWTPDFSLGEVCLDRVPTWIQLKNLGLDFGGWLPWINLRLRLVSLFELIR